MTAPPPDRKRLREALEWYRDAGVDLAVAETPVDRFAASAPPVRPPRAAPAAEAPSPAPNSETDPGVALRLAEGAATLSELEAALGRFEGCGLRLRATNLVFSDGNPEASVMLVGEAPGREEDLQGKPFVGRSGLLLDRMLGTIGLDRDSVYIANTVPWRPPGNRTPSPAEVAACLPFLHRQIELVAPRILVALGGAAAATLFESEQGITRLRGSWRTLSVRGLEVRALATFHPAYLLRQPAAKRLVWQDLAAIRRALAEAQAPS